MTERDLPATAPRGIQNDAHVELLEQHLDYSQRDMAMAFWFCVGKTHYALKALLGKGLVKAETFRDSKNKLGYLYWLPPSGVATRAQLTHTFLAREEDESLALNGEITLLREELAAFTTRADR